jgi:hypothetical protein
LFFISVPILLISYFILIPFIVSVLILLVFNFILIPFIDFFFNFNYSILICVYEVFQFGSSTFDFFFLSWLFYQSFYSFKFYPSNQIYKLFSIVIIYISIWSYSYLFFFFALLSEFLLFLILSFKTSLCFLLFQ